MTTHCEPSTDLALGQNILRALYPTSLAHLGSDPAFEAATDPEAAEELDRRGQSEAALGHYGVAQRLHERALELRQNLHGEHHPDLAPSHCSLGAIAYHQGQHDAAEHHYGRAFRLIEAALGPRHPHLGVILNNLGVIATARGDDITARRHYEASLAIKVELHGWDDPRVAATIQNLGRIAERAGDLRTAHSHFAHARAAFELHGDAAAPGLAAALIGIGRAHLRQGAPGAAIHAFERALHLRESHPSTPSQRAIARFFLALAVDHRDPPRARALVVRARDELRDHEASHAHERQALDAWLTLHDTRHRPRP